MSSSATTHPAPDDGATPFWRLLGRHQLGAVVATAIDFAVMIASVEWLHAPPALAAAVGALVGAVTNFVLGRRWVFRASAGDVLRQAERYAAVAAASAGWNALGEYALHDAGHVEYVIARALVSFAVGVAWNFPLHRRFVFRRESAIGAG
jgi:putative flippase GtrA